MPGLQKALFRSKITDITKCNPKYFSAAISSYVFTNSLSPQNKENPVKIIEGFAFSGKLQDQQKLISSSRADQCNYAINDALTNIYGEVSMNPVTEHTNYVSKEPYLESNKIVDATCDEPICSACVETSLETDAIVFKINPNTDAGQLNYLRTS